MAEIFTLPSMQLWHCLTTFAKKLHSGWLPVQIQQGRIAT